MKYLNSSRGSAESVVAAVAALAILGGVAYYAVSHRGEVSVSTQPGTSRSSSLSAKATQTLKTDQDASAAAAESNALNRESIDDAATTSTDVR